MCSSAVYDNDQIECVTFSGSRIIVGLQGLAPWFHCVLVGISWVQNFFHEYFVSSNIFLIGFSWVLDFFSWVFRGSSIFYRGYFVGPKFLYFYIYILYNFLIISFLQCKDLFTRSSDRQLLQNYLPYWFINYSDFLIANSSYSSPRKNLSSFFNVGPIRRKKMLGFLGSEHSPKLQLLGSMLTT